MGWVLMSRTYHIKTFGCQMNEHDSQKIGGLLESQGFLPTEEEARADFLLFNTCTVREKAHQKAYSEIGKVVKLKKSGRPSLIGVCGCVAQEVGSELLHRFPEIDLVFGPDQIYQLPQLLQWVEEKKTSVIATDLINDPENYHFLDLAAVTRFKGPTAFVTIMKGCNSHCSYCIVPKVRGTEVYRAPRDIVREVEALAEKGCRQVTLLGQNVNSYTDFAGLLRLISQNTEIDRIRFMSPHPKDVKADLIEEYARNPKLCAHIHLPVQSGSDAVLKRMRRAYNRRQYLDKIQKLREAREGIAFTTDIIVGFPGETDIDFAQSLSLLDEAQFDNIYAFKYSVRPDTEAFGFEDDVPTEVKDDRLARLLAAQNKISKRHHEACVGTVQEVLVEGPDRMQRGLLTGRTDSHKIVNFSGEESLIGAIVKVHITQAYTNSLLGEVLGEQNVYRNARDGTHH